MVQESFNYLKEHWLCGFLNCCPQIWTLILENARIQISVDKSKKLNTMHDWVNFQMIHHCFSRPGWVELSIMGWPISWKELLVSTKSDLNLFRKGAMLVSSNMFLNLIWFVLLICIYEYLYIFKINIQLIITKSSFGNKFENSFEIPSISPS